MIVLAGGGNWELKSTTRGWNGLNNMLYILNLQNLLDLRLVVELSEFQSAWNGQKY